MKEKYFKKQIFMTIASVCCVLVWIIVADAACTPSELAGEFSTDSASLGYAPYIANKNDAGLQGLINAQRAGAAYRVNRGRVNTADERQTWGDVIENINLITSTSLQRKWERNVDTFFKGFATLDYSHPQSLAMFYKMVDDGLKKGDGTETLTDADVTARTTRDGSRAEVVCGANVTLNEISCAQRGAGCP